MLKVKRKTKWDNHYDFNKKEQGVVKKPTTKIKIFLFGLIPIKVLYRYRQEYNGLIVEVDKNNNPIFTKRTREKFLKSKIKHSKTRDFVIGNLYRIAKNAESEEVKNIALKTIDQLKENKEYSVNVTPY